MKIRSAFLILTLLGLLLLASLAACNGDTDTQPAATPTSPPSDQEANPLSADARNVVDEFVHQQQTIDEEWDQFRQDFDEWRTGLTSCQSSSVHSALQDFASSFTMVTEESMDLPRSTATRELADMLIEAAEDEERAYRQLRDRWQPGNLSLFEHVEQQRSESARAQRNVEDRAAELRDRYESESSPEEKMALEKFSVDFEALKSRWDSFHDAYAELQRTAVTTDPAEVFAQLQEMVSQFRLIVDSINRLPSSDATGRLVAMLQEAADAELGTLIAVWQGLSAGASAPPMATLEGPEAEQTIPSGNPGQYLDAMNAIIPEVESLLRQVNETIGSLKSSDPEALLAELENFDSHYRKLLNEWDAFHQRYNEWRGTDGGCDRIEVLQSLDRFNLRLRELGGQARDLPQSSYLLPMYTLLVEGIAREEGAIRALRNSWRPFIVDAFKAVDQERLNIDRLRRQADIGLQELLDRS